jgi:hypothetical protein
MRAFITLFELKKHCWVQARYNGQLLNLLAHVSAKVIQNNVVILDFVKEKIINLFEKNDLQSQEVYFNKNNLKKVYILYKKRCKWVCKW